MEGKVYVVLASVDEDDCPTVDSVWTTHEAAVERLRAIESERARSYIVEPDVNRA